jgi:hypothetical protein
MEGMKHPLSRLLSVAGLVLGLTSPAFAQDPQSAAPARELAQLLADRKLESVAARMPGTPDEFAAALAFPGQMIVIWAKFSAPSVLNEKIIKREFREAYIDLNSASSPESRHFVTDLGADGIRRGGKNQPSDSHDVGGKSMRFDGNWKEDKMSEQDYVKAYAEADAAYAKVLGILIEQMKKSS